MFPRYFGTTRFSLVEVIIPNSYTKDEIAFPDQPDLRSDQDFDIVIQAIETYTQFDRALSQSGNTMPTVAQLIATQAIWYVDGDEAEYKMPLVDMHRAISVDGSGNVVPYVRDLQVFDNIQVSWDKCKLQNPASNGWNTGGSGTFSFEFGIHYLRLPAGTMSKIRKVQAANYANFGNASR